MLFEELKAPSASDPLNELSDYEELKCLEDGNASMRSLSKRLGLSSERDYVFENGVSGEEEEDDIAADVYMEIDRRSSSCRGGYPFTVNTQGNYINSKKDDDNRFIVYKYLLLATRLDMNKYRIQNKINGTKIFEKLAAEVAKNYLGPRAESLVFGDSGNFEKRINYLCQKIGEGNVFLSKNWEDPKAKDDKLDIVAWKSFSDNYPSKLLAFGQCKTGTNYQDYLTELQPAIFCKTWMRYQPIVDPVRIFFLADSISKSHWYSIASKAGILFDRCRIIDYCEDIPNSLLTEIRDWTTSVAHSIGLSSL